MGYFDKQQFLQDFAAHMRRPSKPGLEKIIEVYLMPLCRGVARARFVRFRHNDDREDAIQIALIQCVMKLAHYRIELDTSPMSYFTRIARNAMLEYAQRRQMTYRVEWSLESLCQAASRFCVSE